MRKGLLTAALAALSLFALLLIPGSALAVTGPITIAAGTESVPGAGSCNFVADAPGENITPTDLQACLTLGATSITDPPGVGGGIEFDGSTVSGCTGALTIDEEGTGGTVDFAGTTSFSGCDLKIEAPGAVTESHAVTANAIDFDTQGTVTLNTASNVIGSISGSVSGPFGLDSTEALAITSLTNPGGGVDINPGGSVTISGPIDASGTVALTTIASGAGITEQSGGSITAPTLHANGEQNTTLTQPGNQVGTLEASSGAQIDFTDAEPGGLELNDIEAYGGYTIINSGNIDSPSTLYDIAPGSEDSLTSQDGSVTSTGYVSAIHLSALGTSVSLTSARDEIEALDATATSGNVNVELYEATPTLGNMSATGTVTVTNDDGSLKPTGSISGQSIALSADGFLASTGAALAAPSVALTDSDTSDGWTVTPTAITPTGSHAIAYSGASSLSIDGGALFNVNPSSSTTMTLTGDAPTAGVLDYNAEGGLVTGSTTAPTGAIDNSEYKPVSFSAMTSVQITNAGTPPPPTTTTTTPTTTTTTTTPAPVNTNAPTCALRAASSKLTLPKKVHGKLKGRATLTLVATCSAAVNATLVGRITAVNKPKHGKAKSKFYGVALIHVALGANTAKKIVINVPAAVVTALANKRDRLSAGFTMADPGHGDDVLKTVTISHLT